MDIDFLENLDWCSADLVNDVHPRMPDLYSLLGWSPFVDLHLIRRAELDTTNVHLTSQSPNQASESSVDIDDLSTLSLISLAYERNSGALLN